MGADSLKYSTAWVDPRREMSLRGPVAPSTLGRAVGVQRMQFLARFKAYCLAGGDAYLGAGTWVAADAGFACADAEDAKSAQFDALTGGESLFKALEDRIHRGLCLGAGQARALDNMMDDVLLNQRSNLTGATGMTVLRRTELMLQDLHRLWNSINGSKQFFNAGKPVAGGWAAGPEAVVGALRAMPIVNCARFAYYGSFEF